MNLLYYKACIRYFKEKNIYEDFIKNFKCEAHKDEDFFDYLSYYVRYKFHDKWIIQEKIREFKVCGLFTIKGSDKISVKEDIIVPSNKKYYYLMTKKFLWLFKFIKLFKKDYI